MNKDSIKASANLVLPEPIRVQMALKHVHNVPQELTISTLDKSTLRLALTVLSLIIIRIKDRPAVFNALLAHIPLLREPFHARIAINCVLNALVVLETNVLNALPTS